MYNIVEALKESLENKDRYTLKNKEEKELAKIYLSPSESMVTLPDGAPIGSCIRKVWLSKKKAPVTNPTTAYNEIIFDAGHMWEDWLVEQYKKLGIYIDRSIKFVNNTHNISCEIDILHRNPETGEKEITECKQYNGSNWYASKELLGSSNTTPKPKDDNLLQCVKYAVVMRDYGIKNINLVYLDRSCGNFYNHKQFKVYLQGDDIYYDTLMNGSLITLHEDRFKVKDLFEKDYTLITFLEQDVPPPPDYFIQYNSKTLELDYDRGNITKTKYESIKSGKIPIEEEGSWRCKYCPYSKNFNTGESTCLNYS